MKYIIIIIVTCLFFSCQVSETKNSQSELSESEILVDSNSLNNVTVASDTNPENCIKELINAVNENNIEKAQELLEQGCNVNGTIEIAKNYKVSPLKSAIDNINSDMAKLLLKYGADPDQNLGIGTNPFHYSAGRDNHETFLLLLDKCKDVNILHSSNYPTPLLWAISRGKIENVKKLIEKGAVIDPAPINGMSSALAVAFYNSSLEIFKYLLEKGANVDAQFSEMSEDCLPCPYDITILHYLVDMNRYTETADVRQFLNILVK